MSSCYVKFDPNSYIYRTVNDLNSTNYWTKLIPSVTPMRMSGNDVREYHKNGLVRSTGYMEILKATLKSQEHALFEDAILEIRKYGVTIEQEVFLSV